MKKTLTLTVSICALLCIAFVVLTVLPFVAYAAATAEPISVTCSFYDGALTRGFCWYTSRAVTNGQAQVIKVADGTAKNSVNWTAAQTIDAEYKDVQGAGDTSPYRMWKAHVLDLTANATYYYRVGSAAAWSDVGMFQTSVNDGVRMIHVTDTQGYTQADYNLFYECLAGAHSVMPNPQSIIFTGDIVTTANNFQQWNFALDGAKQYFMNTTVTPSAGNHERSGGHFFNRFDIKAQPGANTETGVYYSYDVDNVHFTVLNNNDMTSDSVMTPAQVEWLKADLAATTAQWKVVIMHYAMVSPGEHGIVSSSDPTLNADMVNARNVLMPIFSQYQVDLALAGHEHIYSRSEPYRWGTDSGKTVQTGYFTTQQAVFGQTRNVMVNPQGTPYICLNASGYLLASPMTNRLPDFFTYAKNDKGVAMKSQPYYQMFGALQIKDGQLLYQVYNVNGGVAQMYDYVAIQKTQPLTAAQLQEAQDVMDLIDALSPIDLSKKDQVTQARTRYDSLNQTQKSLVTNYSILLRAEEVIASLEADQAPANTQGGNQGQPNPINYPLVISLSVVGGVVVAGGVAAAVILVVKRKKGGAK